MTRNSENKTVSETREDIESDAPGMLWVVATPIGTIEDFSPRACRVLGEANLILAEDTRRTRKLLTHFEIPTRGRLHSLHLHNEKRSTARATKIITGGGSVALVSDAGTPVLSDPGHMLVCAAHEMGAQVMSVPGPSSFTAALAASPQRPLPATLVGFLPAKAGERTRRLKELGKTPWTIVVLLSPHRLATEVTALAENLGEDRPATLMAELSKAHERFISGSLSELRDSAEVAHPRGEYVIVIGPPNKAPKAEPTPADVEVRYRSGVADGLGRRAAIRAVAEHFEVSQRHVYSLLLEAEKSP